MIYDYFRRSIIFCLFLLRMRNPKNIPSDMFTMPSAVRMKFGLVNTTSPMNMPQNPAMKNMTVMIVNLRLEGVVISDFDFMALLNIERIVFYITKLWKTYLGKFFSYALNESCMNSYSLQSLCKFHLSSRDVMSCKKVSNFFFFFKISFN